MLDEKTAHEKINAALTKKAEFIRLFTEEINNFGEILSKYLADNGLCKKLSINSINRGTYHQISVDLIDGIKTTNLLMFFLYPEKLKVSLEPKYKNENLSKPVAPETLGFFKIDELQKYFMNILDDLQFVSYLE